MVRNKLTIMTAALASAALLAACGGEVATSNTGSSDPTSPVTVIVPNAAGGTSDIVARLLADKLTEKLDRKFSIENIDAAGGQVGVQRLADAKPDGSTIGFTNIPTVIGLYTDPARDAQFDRESFTPLAGLTSVYLSVAVNSSSPYKTFDDLVAAAKANPGKISWATGGALSNDHLAALDIEKTAGVEFNIVHLDGGSAKMTALLGEKIDVIPGSGDFVPQLAGNTIRILTTLGPSVLPAFGDVPTAESLGYDIVQPAGIMLSGPKGLPKDFVKTFDDAMEAILKDPETVKEMDALGLNPAFLDSAELGSFWQEQDKVQIPLLESASQDK